jgi:hypothetical protein
MPKTKSGKLIPYEEGGAAQITDIKDLKGPPLWRDLGPTSSTVSDATVTEALGILLNTPTGTRLDEDDRERSERTMKAATPEQRENAFEQLGIPKGMNTGGVVRDELGYMHGGMKFKERGSVKYSAGGAVKGKNFAGTF